MNGPQDLGGAHGFGPVRWEPETDRFHAAWERRAFALTLAMGATGLWPLDRARLTRESLPAATYYASSYYAIWFAALETLVREAGIGGDAPTPPKRVLEGREVRAAMARGGPTSREGPAPRFALGDTVRVRAMNPEGHTRAPRYVRGRLGRVTAQHGPHVFPDTNAHGLGERPQPLYGVAFEAAELWGPDTTASEVRLDLFEPYLEAA